MSLLNELPRREELLAQLNRASELAQAGRNEEALEVARRVEAACAAAKVKSSHVHWAISVLNDNAGHLSEALAHILVAVALDPLCLPVETSLGIIVRRVRKKLTEEAWDQGAVALYQALAGSGLADDASRVAYGRYLLGQGEHEEALHVAQAVALLCPRLAEAWGIVEAAAHALGNEKLAEEAAGQSMAARAESPGFTPNVRWGQA